MSRYFFDITGMASSSVSQEDFDNDYELTSRRPRIRTARARAIPPARATANVSSSAANDIITLNFQKNPVDDEPGICDSGSTILPGDHDTQQNNKPIMRKQDKRITNRVSSVVSCLHRPIHINKGKQQRDRRKLREKRRSTGVVHLPSTESTGGSTGEDEEELVGTCVETKNNTQHNEFLDHELIEERTAKVYTQRRNKSHSDLEADDEEFDSLNQSDSVNQSDHGNHSSHPHPLNSNINRDHVSTPTDDDPQGLLERAQEENRRLLTLLESQDQKIMALEAQLLQQQREMVIERDRLRDENAALIRAMAALASN
ncbi:PRKC apoptosis WT1 regulator protein-like isoform X2 [Microplitis mediator]|uniref:PRKC apoptosis WT1 regulator protein-like isoform X2 n=1 Tax=Microplitis mediator TaxID=375433 RepID=UPI0025521E76|nr:PRKC apoptosis WT1 regulator protein-like isoform X2 [Microplitis mediator]